MEIQEILRELEFNKEHRFPRAALEAAIAERGAIAPHLIRFIEHAYENVEHLGDKREETGTFIGHIFAMFLLAQFREKAAYPPIVKFFSLPGEVAHDVTGDVVTEHLANILASVCCGDTSLIKEMVENPGLSEWVRGAAVCSFLCLVAAGVTSREEVVEYYAELFRGKLERQPSNAWASLVSGAADLSADELQEEIDKAFHEGLVESFFIAPENVEDDLARDKGQVRQHLQRQRYGLVENTIKEMEWWACFHPERYSARKRRPSGPPPRRRQELALGDVLPQATGVEPVSAVRAERAPGRNDPCPCGSGRKYKHCCARKPKEST